MNSRVGDQIESIVFLLFNEPEQGRTVRMFIFVLILSPVIIGLN